ncbi:protein transport protein Sec31A [Reticulomyxa filosa]|uniref:Protein transport protein Sec31A n=1 Tax=Reticulomyxa filosa TaxID=46433 RepID=X6NPT5_RETFI|nr:protein transport protein Sec31A [Reticulomyxa filosa]|eukprot:ETO27918.1 protein transport protein Sec31A [Reticulomyxa filosa]
MFTLICPMVSTTNWCLLQLHFRLFLSTFKKQWIRGRRKKGGEENLKNWKETLAIILSFCKGDAGNKLCNLLGQRLVREAENVHGAVTCYLCSHNVAELINLWTLDLLGSQTYEEVKAAEVLSKQVSPDLVLHECIEKVLVFINAPSVPKSKENVNALADIFSKYATLLASQGSLQVSAQFLKFISDARCPAGTYVNEETQALLQRIAISESDVQHTAAATTTTFMNTATPSGNATALHAQPKPPYTQDATSRHSVISRTKPAKPIRQAHLPSPAYDTTSSQLPSAPTYPNELNQPTPFDLKKQAQPQVQQPQSQNESRLMRPDRPPIRSIPKERPNPIATAEEARRSLANPDTRPQPPPSFPTIRRPPSYPPVVNDTANNPPPPDVSSKSTATEHLPFRSAGRSPVSQLEELQDNFHWM